MCAQYWDANNDNYLCGTFFFAEVVRSLAIAAALCVVLAMHMIELSF